MLPNHDDLLNKVANWDLFDDIDETENSETKPLYIYKQLQSYFKNYFMHFENVLRISEQFHAIIQDFIKESERIGHVADFIKNGAEKQTVEIEKSMRLVKVFSDKVSSIYEKSQDIISLAYDMEKNNQIVEGSVGQLISNQEKNDVAVKNMFDVISQLILKTQKIGEITEMMDRVSSETFLLGLNAKVEAVRAGSYGRGFSVVAEEVQRLSEESKSATEKINDTLKTFSDEINTLEKVAKESQSLFRVQKDTIDDVDRIFKKNCETINTYIKEQQGFNSSIAEIRNDESILTSTIQDIFTSVREISATTNEIGVSLIDHNNSISFMDRLEKDNSRHIDAMGKDNTSIKVQKSAVPKRKIAFLFDVDHPFYSPTKTEALKAAGIYNYDVSFFAPQSRDQSAKEQAALIDKIIKEKYDGLVISPINDDFVYQKLTQAVKAGIRIIFLNAKLNNIEHISLIMTDGLSIGAAAARIAMGAMGSHGEAIVNAWSGLKIDAIENRKDGFVKELRKNSKISVHEYPVKSNPTPQESEAIISSMLQAYPDAKFLYLTNLDWGMYAVDYMRKYNPEIQVITVDFSEEVSRAIQEGSLHYALGQRAYLWGSTAMTLLDHSFHNKKVQKSIDTGTFEVNKLNVDIYSSLM
jgi:methyl-accepting chemotaxis protein/ABC-type sugar transport system substrate-binding protein